MTIKARAAGITLTGAVLASVYLIADFEGLRHKAYLDPIGIPTICYGHTAGVRLGDQMTKQQCDDLLTSEVLEFMASVDRLVTVPMPDTRKAAMTSFAYNVGINNFRRSTLLRFLNAGQTRAACNELTRWVYAGGKKLNGLVNRRAKERELCLEGLPKDV